MAARFVFSAARGAVVATMLTACSSLPDIRFDEPGSAVVVASCTCQVPPAGWTPVNFVATARPSCPTAETPRDLRVASGDGTPSCTCTCEGVGGACTTGNFALTVTGEATCAVAPKTASIPVDVGACTALGGSITVPSSAFAKAAPPAPTSCGAKSGLKAPLTDGRLCEPPRSTSCSADQVCAPTATSGLVSCVTRAGTNACPPDFPKRSTAGTAADESKACIGCGCGAPTACAGGTVSLYDGSMCRAMGSAHGFDVASGCAATSDGNFTATHFKSTPPNGGCAPMPTTQPSPGMLSFTDTRTICCK